MNATNKKKAHVADIVHLMESIAPSYLAESWDNCGLQVGTTRWEVRKIWVALDPLIQVLEDAARHNVDMVITHHPLILKGLKAIDLDTTEGKVIDAALKNKTAVFAAHTNLDSATDGINDVLAGLIGLLNTIPLVASDPNGDPGVPVGLGRIGDIGTPLPVKQWAREIKSVLALGQVKVAGNLERVVHRAAVCSGSGGSLIDAFLNSDADVYVSGDMKYHDARAVEDAGRAFIDIGHFASEHIMIDALVKKLEMGIEDASLDVLIEPCVIEKDPFRFV